MKTVSCKDFGAADDFVAKGEDIREVIDKMVKHIRKEHPEMADKSDDELEDMIRPKIKDENLEVEA